MCIVIKIRYVFLLGLDQLFEEEKVFKLESRTRSREKERAREREYDREIQTECDRENQKLKENEFSDFCTL